MVELMDLGATLVDLAGGRPAQGSAARSLAPLLRDLSAPHREVALSELRREAMVATADWKLAVNRQDEPYLLYDLRDDPLETRNLAGLPEYEPVERELVGHLRTTLVATA